VSRPPTKRIEATPRPVPTLAEDASRNVTRFVIRSLRILAGSVVGCFAWWAASECLERMGKRLGSLTLLDLLAAVGLGFAAFTLVGTARACAFGEGPRALALHASPQ
jgi:hypothetical protein